MSNIDINPTIYNVHQQRILLNAINRNIDISLFSNPKYDWRQMREIMKGIEDKLDVSIYTSIDFNWEQMEQIRYGLMEGIDASKYAWKDYSVKQMSVIRSALNLLQIRENSEGDDIGDRNGFQRYYDDISEIEGRYENNLLSDSL